MTVKSNAAEPLVYEEPETKQRPRGDSVHQERGKVLDVDGRVLVVESNGRRYRAKRAISCLVEPSRGDLVLVAVGEDGTGHALAVLERPEGAPDSPKETTVAVEGDLLLKTQTGRVRIAAQEGIDLVTAKDAKVVASGFSVSAATASIVVEAMSAVGGALKAEIDRVKVVGRALDHVFDRFTQRVKASYRTVEELDRLRAKNVDHVAEGTMKVHAREAVVTADGLVKMDAEQIHIG
jgi:hypothetical protein